MLADFFVKFYEKGGNFLIHVCYALRDESGKYSKFVGMSIQSLLENTKEDVTIHLLHDSTLSLNNQQKFRKLAYTQSQEIMFHDVEKLVPDKLDFIDSYVQNLPKNKNKFAPFYRLLIPNILSQDIERAIYLDSDTIVNLDIAELWNVDLNWFPIAAVTQASVGESKEEIENFEPLVRQKILKSEDYFNSGVLLLDLERIRSFEIDGLLERCLKVRASWGTQQKLMDQNALNFIFKENFLKLPPKFNRLVFLARRLGNPKKAGREIIHYASQTFGTKFTDDYDRLWFEYYCRTPFFSSENVIDLLTSSRNSAIQKGFLWKRIVNLDMTRQRGFFMYPKDSDQVVRLIGKNDNAIGLNADFPNAIDHLTSTMEENRGNISFFIKVEDEEYHTIRDLLIGRGFEEYIDFFNVEELKLNDNGYRFIKSM